MQLKVRHCLKSERYLPMSKCPRRRPYSTLFWRQLIIDCLPTEQTLRWRKLPTHHCLKPVTTLLTPPVPTATGILRICKVQMDSRQLILSLSSPVRGDALTVWVGWLFVTQRVCVVWLDAIKTGPLCLETFWRRLHASTAARWSGERFLKRGNGSATIKSHGRNLSSAWHPGDPVKLFVFKKKKKISL